ncbi:hypothetical protein GYMLUDRAFT_253218 [Collybiopsis luxurians FD-317 M1]|uniref:DUF6570 domain-containing protein n=1 Tax=Collybiopsis luxurians FD-317 M1 TaxID=944289 RepID=A0A0D0B7S8_9AGAR|nr:hypothetical protein GYMLUDRAFT_253218 [Collybiopsis luxurians FD-317 M1]
MVVGKRKLPAAFHSDGPPLKSARYNLTSTATSSAARNNLDSASLSIQSYTKKMLLRVFDECGVKISLNDCRTKASIEEYLQSLDRTTANTILNRLNEVRDGTDVRHNSVLNFRRDEIILGLEKANIFLSPAELKTKSTMELAIKRQPEGVQANLMQCLSQLHRVGQDEVLQLERQLSAFNLAYLLELAKEAGASIKSMESRTYGGFARGILKAPVDKRDMFLLKIKEMEIGKQSAIENFRRRLSDCTHPELKRYFHQASICLPADHYATKHRLLNAITGIPSEALDRLRECIDQTTCPIIDRPFMSAPSEPVRQNLVEEFIHATGKDAVSQVICCICGREVFASEARGMEPNEIPHPELLAPAKPHPAQELTSNMLLYRDPETKTVPPFACLHCLTYLTGKVPQKPALSLSNNMWIGEVPLELRNLTLCERILISRYYAAAYIVKLYPKHGSRKPEQLISALKGNVSTYFLDTDRIAGLVDEGYLPPNPRILAATIGVTFIGRNRKPLKYLPKYLTVDRRRIRLALQWLIPRNPLYANIRISERNLDQLPEGEVPFEVRDNIRWLEDESVLDKEHNGYVPDFEDRDLEDGCEEVHSEEEVQSEEESEILQTGSFKAMA